MVAQVEPCAGLARIDFIERGGRVAMFAEAMVADVPVNVALRELEKAARKASRQRRSRAGQLARRALMSLPSALSAGTSRISSCCLWREPMRMSLHASCQSLSCSSFRARAIFVVSKALPFRARLCYTSPPVEKRGCSERSGARKKELTKFDECRIISSLRC